LICVQVNWVVHCDLQRNAPSHAGVIPPLDELDAAPGIAQVASRSAALVQGSLPQPAREAARARRAGSTIFQVIGGNLSGVSGAPKPWWCG
jgi:hypothetical protein